MNELLLSDAHAHLGNEDELKERRENGIVSLLCATTPVEAGALFQKIGWTNADFPAGIVSDPIGSDRTFSGQTLIPTCGLHPWHADQYALADMIPYLESVPVIGEIGMDSVWCSVPSDIQKEVFCRQLALACEMKKPVILHTKGQEKEIAAIIRHYPNRYLVHWYSCENYLEEYLALDCYFSIGPDVWWNPAVQQVAKKAPLDRLLIETDGLGAVTWAWEEAPRNMRQNPAAAQNPKALCGSMAPQEITLSASLLHTLKTVAGLRNLSAPEAARRTRDNLIWGFLPT